MNKPISNATGIYKITNLVNGKIYIGSSINCKIRWGKHISELRGSYHVNNHLQNAWNKYGENNFSFEIIEIVKKEEKLLEREQYYLNILLLANQMNKKFFELGYNASRKAGRVIVSKEQALNRAIKNRRKIIQIDSSSIKVKIWNSIKDAAEKLKIHPSLITRCCRKTLKTAGTFQWEYLKEKHIGVKKIKIKKVTAKPVLQFDLNGKFIKEFSSIKAASIYTNTPHERIGVICANKGRVSNGFVWCFKNHPEPQKFINTIIIEHNKAKELKIKNLLINKNKQYNE